jgi:hypothetical protein
MTPSRPLLSAGYPVPATGELIEVHVSELKQLFNAIDPSPSANETSIQRPRNSSLIGRKRLHRRRLSGSWSTWTSQPDCRTNRRSSGTPSTSSSVTARNVRDAACASCFAGAGRASRLVYAHSAPRWPLEILSGASSAITSPRFSRKVCSSAGGSPCGDPWKSSSTTGGRFGQMLRSPTG